MTETEALARVGLGTAQFGSDYGISNPYGRPGDTEIAATLACAIAAGHRYVDTATGYADAETLLGRYLPRNHQMRIVTKVEPVHDLVIKARHGGHLIDTLRRSLERLKVERTYGLLVHRASDLAKPGAEWLVEALYEARVRGLVNHIGVSVYDANELALAESRFSPEIVQLPLNVLDQRPIASGTLVRLKRLGAEIHARSVFLQGLLLMKPKDLPEFFEPIRDQIAVLQTCWMQSGLHPLAGCLAFVLNRPEVDVALVGVNQLSELKEIHAAIATIATRKNNVIDVPSIDSIYLNPSRWP